MKKGKYIFHVFIFMLGVCLQYQRVEATNININKVTIQLYDVKQDKYYSPDTDISSIQKGQVMQLIYTIQGNTNIDATIIIPETKGLDNIRFISWNEEVIANESSDMLQTTVQMNASDNTLVLEGIYQGAINNKLNPSISILFLDTTSYTKGFTFVSNETSHNVDSKVIVEFFTPDGKLLSKQTIDKGSYAKIPNYKPMGYTVLGYQEKGNTTYYQSGPLYTSTSFLAIIEPNKYNINYYVDNQKYKTVEAYYASSVEYIESPKKEGYVFVEWVGIIDNIHKDLDVYAVYKNSIGDYFIDEEIIQYNEQDLKTILIRKQTEYVENDAKDVIDNVSIFYLQEDGEFKVVENKQKIVNENASINNKNINVWFIILLIIFIIYVIIKRLKKSNLLSA
ncbi:MAG: hypothetical protein ACK5LC_03815 [Coprobacillaceae bacterium]